MDDEWSSRRTFLASAGTALSAAIAGCSLGAPSDSPEQSETAQSEQFSNEPQRPPQQEQAQTNSQLTNVYKEVVDSVTAVRVEGGMRGAAGGTAWVYDDDYLVTNEHVVREGTDPFIWFTDIGWRDASIVGKDLYSDLAVLEAENKPSEATPIELVDEEPPVGTRVAAVGNPFELTGSFTTGVVSGRNRTIQIPRTPFSIADGVQTDAALNPGNSGGPLITHDGEVVGVINSGIRGTQSNPAENIGFAISAAMVREVVPELIEEGEYEHSYMGVGLRDVTPGIIDANDLNGVRWGVYIGEVVEDGPSAGALRGTQRTELVRGQQVPVGGDVIVRMGDWTIQNRERLSAFLALETRPGDTIDIEVVRDGERETVEITVGSRPDPEL
jgi:S1-C subfamily serine protease